MYRQVAPLALLCCCLTASITHPCFAQRRWLELKPAEQENALYMPVDWDSISAVVGQSHSSGMSYRLYTVKGGKPRLLGTVAEGTSSATRIQQILKDEQDRWVQGWPQLNGDLQKPNVARAYADLRFATSLSDVKPIDTGGAPTWRIGGLGIVVGIVEGDERARVQKMIDDSTSK